MDFEIDEHIAFDEQTEIDAIDITNDFMFTYVMREPEICKRLLECLLPGHHIQMVKYVDMDDPKATETTKPETQKVMNEGFNKRGVRLDAYLDDGKTIYNIEMQTTEQPAIAKRARLYQAHLDVNQLNRGRSFDQLKPSYVIFICKFDPFGEGLHYYTFRNTCVQDSNIELKDESYKVFFNTNGTKGEISSELKQVLSYMNDTETFPVEASDNHLIQMIEEAVNRAKMNDEWRRSYMMYSILQRDAELRGEVRGKQEGIAIGEKQGIAIGEKQGIFIGEKKAKEETARKMLHRGMSVHDVADLTSLSTADVQALKNTSAPQ